MLYCRVNKSHVTHETIEERAIVVHILSGAYYDLDHLATEIWSIISNPVGLFIAGRIIEPLRSLEFDNFPNFTGVCKFINYLYQEGLILVENGTDISQGIQAHPRLDSLDNTLELAIHKHSEMAMFLKLDPILMTEDANSIAISNE